MCTNYRLFFWNTSVRKYIKYKLLDKNIKIIYIDY